MPYGLFGITLFSTMSTVCPCNVQYNVLNVRTNKLELCPSIYVSAIDLKKFFEVVNYKQQCQLTNKAKGILCVSMGILKLQGLYFITRKVDMLLEQTKTSKRKTNWYFIIYMNIQS